MPKKNTKLKLYVWEDVLTDWTSGIAFALASSPEEAKAKLIESGLDACSHWNGLKLDGVECSVYEDPVALYCHGGG